MILDIPAAVPTVAMTTMVVTQIMAVRVTGPTKESQDEGTRMRAMGKVIAVPAR
jgi:hypothetical protein